MIISDVIILLAPFCTVIWHANKWSNISVKPLNNANNSYKASLYGHQNERRVRNVLVRFFRLWSSTEVQISFSCLNFKCFWRHSSHKKGYNKIIMMSIKGGFESSFELHSELKSMRHALVKLSKQPLKTRVLASIEENWSFLISNALEAMCSFIAF